VGRFDGRPQHLLKRYDKFAIGDGDERRPVALAREALRSGVVGLGELSDGPGERLAERR